MHAQKLIHRCLNGIDRAIRWAWTALSFFLFGLGGLVAGMAVLPILALFVWDGDRRERMARSIVSQLFRVFIGFMALVGLDWRLTGLDPDADRARCLVVANHPTLIDVVFLLALFPGASCVVKRAYWSNPFTFIVMRLARYIPNHDTAQLIADSGARLRAGDCLVLFPEGTRTVPGQPPRFKRGAALIAIQAAADIQPVRIACTPLTLAKHMPWYRVPARRPAWHIEVLPRIPATSYDALGGGERERSHALNRKVQSLLTAGVK